LGPKAPKPSPVRPRPTGEGQPAQPYRLLLSETVAQRAYGILTLCGSTGEQKWRPSPWCPPPSPPPPSPSPPGAAAPLSPSPLPRLVPTYPATLLLSFSSRQFVCSLHITRTRVWLCASASADMCSARCIWSSATRCCGHIARLISCDFVIIERWEQGACSSFDVLLDFGYAIICAIIVYCPYFWSLVCRGLEILPMLCGQWCLIRTAEC
jgi:hypothetical protein